MAIEKAAFDAAVSTVTTVSEFFGKLVGVLPRGDFQKFKRTIYPHMVVQADRTGKGVYAFWFGDVIRVGPGGSWGSVAVVSSVAGAEEIFRQRADKEGQVYVIRCGAEVDWNSDSSIRAGCSFDRLEGSFFSRVREGFLDLLPGDNQDISDTRGLPLPDPVVVKQAGFGIDTPVFAIIAVLALVFILPRLAEGK